MNKKQAQQYRDEVRAIAEHYGAVYDETFHTGSVHLHIPTPVGKVSLSIFDDWVAIRLPVDLIHITEGGAFMANPFSGKWNIMSDTTEHDELHRRLGRITGKRRPLR